MGTCAERDERCGIGKVLVLKVRDAAYVYGHRKDGLDMCLKLRRGSGF